MRYVFSEYVKGVSKDNITKELNKQGHLYKGKPFQAKNFDLWLKNEKYTGTFSFGGRECSNKAKTTNTIREKFTSDRADLLNYIDELVKGDPNDKEYQKRIIDNLIYKVEFYDDRLRLFINFNGGTEVAEFTHEQADDAESRAIKAKTIACGVQTHCATLRQL